MNCAAIFEYTFPSTLTLLFIGFGGALAFLFELREKPLDKYALDFKRVRMAIFAYVASLPAVYGALEVFDLMRADRAVIISEGKLTDYRNDLVGLGYWPFYGRLCVENKCFDFTWAVPSFGYRGVPHLNNWHTRMNGRPFSGYVKVAATPTGRIMRIDACSN